MSSEAQFRQLPSVDELASSLANIEDRFPRRLIVAECRRAIESARSAIRTGAASPPALAHAVIAVLESLAAPSLRHVINATGVILHTNLGRAPLPAASAPGPYSNLEFDLVSGRRGKRDTHISPLLERLLGRPAIAVNNGAAAVWLALHELASGGDVIVSRGELIEIGDGFRIPDIMARSGARLVEAGTTNRTRIEDYRDAITPQTRLLMRVHPSNFRIQGFTGRPTLEQLAALSRERDIPLYEDLGSGCLVNLGEFGVDEPLAQESLRAGVDLISFSGDKLLGGPQAGILAGRPDLVQRLRANPMFRALRLDKLVIAAMEVTLRKLLLDRFEDIPALRMIRTSPEEIRQRADRLLRQWDCPNAELIEGESLIGGGSTPDQALKTWLIAISGDAIALERRLRLADPPVIARIESDLLLLDLRTVDPSEEAGLLSALKSSWPARQTD
ncbi:MAG TPA: L-seryl-tRNA(Sec) selenium transferase [Bryobacteraceae bacterium]|nr:L-seryl-tRNA(Sec) selenium transferase [Bryobacteraceae bacterium]